MRALSKIQIERQDFVDNAIFELLQKLSPTDTKIEYDIDAIGNVRDTLTEIFVHKLKVTSEDKFYPYLNG